MNYGCSAAIGAVSGLRSMSGPAIISEAASRNIVKLRRTPLAWLGSDRAARTSALLAVGELIADKLPFMPDRTQPASLAFRALAGALSGYAICGKKKSPMAAFVGGAAALAAAYAGIQYRKRVHLPPVAAALIEDAVAIGAGALAVQLLHS
jgi:uncharacterized membrane protein